LQISRSKNQISPGLRFIEMSTRIRYLQKRVIYNNLKFSENYKYHYSPVHINLDMSADLNSIS